MPKLTLSQVSADFDTVLSQLVDYKNAVQNSQVWRDFMVSGTGQTLLELMAACAVFNQHHILSSFREAFPSTAVRDSSLYAIARMLGVDVTRKIPAALGVRILNTHSDQTVTLDRYSSFSVDGMPFFNRSRIVLPPSNNYLNGQTLFEGSVKTKTLGSITQPGDVYLNELGFVVSSYPGDFILTVVEANGMESLWSRAIYPLWSYDSTAKVYYMNTSGDGDVVLTFGDGTHGQLPGANSTVKVQYVVTQGSAVNKAVTLLAGGSMSRQISVSYPNDPLINVSLDISQEGEGNYGISGGVDEKSASFYKTYSPYLFRAKQGITTKTDYTAYILSLGGIASTVVEAQRDIDPSNVTFMNVVRVCALPSDPDVDLFTVAQKNVLVESIERYAHACVTVHMIDPQVIVIALTLTIYCNPTYNLDALKTKTYNKVVDFFTKKANSLGRKVYLSDLISLLMSTNGVDHCRVQEQTNNALVDFTDKTAGGNKVFYRLNQQTLTVNASYTDRQVASVDSYL